VPKRRDKAEPPGSSAAGTLLLLIAAGCAAFPGLRNWHLIVAMAGLGVVMTFVGSGRVYRPAVTREGDTVNCRFNPWREAAFYAVPVGMPLVGFMAIAGADLVDVGSPGLWRIVGVLIIVGTPILLLSFVRQTRQSLLRISPSALSLRRSGQHHGLTEIPRRNVEAITATTVRMRNYDSAPATEITYQDRHSIPATTLTVLFGPTNTKKTSWLTIDQPDLLAGLQAWKDGDPNDPTLMDRVEAILCGQSANLSNGIRGDIAQ